MASGWHCVAREQQLVNPQGRSDRREGKDHANDILLAETYKCPSNLNIHQVFEVLLSCYLAHMLKLSRSIHFGRKSSSFSLCYFLKRKCAKQPYT
jgi:hypothetical protein